MELRSITSPLCIAFIVFVIIMITAPIHISKVVNEANISDAFPTDEFLSSRTILSTDPIKFCALLFSCSDTTGFVESV